MKVFRNIALGVVVLMTVIIIGSCGFYKYMISPISKDEKIIEVEIPANSSRSTIAKILKEQKLIRDENFFLLYVKLFKISDMKAGYYDLSKSMSTKELVDVLSKMKVSTSVGNLVEYVMNKVMEFAEDYKDIYTRNIYIPRWI